MLTKVTAITHNTKLFFKVYATNYLSHIFIEDNNKQDSPANQQELHYDDP